MVIDRVARQPVTALKPIPARNFQTNEIQLLVQEPSILLAGTSRRSCFAETRLSTIRIKLGRIDKKKFGMHLRKTEKKSAYDDSKICFLKTSKSFKKFETWEMEAIEQEALQ